MTEYESIVSTAVESDLDSILELQEANQTARGGSLSASLPRSRIAAMMQEMPLIVARRGAHVTGFLMSTSRTMNADIPIVKAMFDAYQGTPEAYVYGPVCVGEEERGKGLAQKMFAALKRLEPGREGILFIRQDNEPSLRAHVKMGMNQVASFSFKGSVYAVFSYVA